MQKLILYIQPQLRNTTTEQDFVRVDLMEEELISLTQVIQDVSDIEKLFTDYSKTFNLPASKTNNKIFKHWYNPDVEGFDANVFCESRIELNHLHFRFGKIQLNEVVMKFGEPSMYKVTFFGNTVSFKDKINDDQLSDLVWLNNFNHDADADYVKAALEFGKDVTVDSVSYSNAIIYPLIAHSQSYIYDGTGNTNNGLNISTQSTHHQQRGVVPEDLKPAIPVKNILKAIEEQYSITFKTGEFFDSTAMNNLYLWLHRAKGRITGDLVTELTGTSFVCQTTANCVHYNGTAYDSVQFSQGDYVFTQRFSESGNPPTPMEEGFKFTVNINPASNTIPYTIEIVDSLTDSIVATASNLLGAQNHSIGYGFGQSNTLALNESRRLFARVRSVDALTFSASLSIEHSFYDPDTQNRDFGLIANYNSQSSSIVTSATIIITEQVPKLSIKDFLNGLFRAFNLTAYVDFLGHVVVKTLDNYYAGGDSFDITEYIKTDQHTVGEALPFSNVDLEYSEPKSILAQTFLSMNNRRYGELNYIGDASKKSEYKITLPFEHMLYERLEDKTSGALTLIQNGSFLDDDLNPSIGQPLLFYGVEITGIYSTPINFLYSTRPETYGALCPNGTNYTLNNYWMPHNANELGTSTTAPTYNLNFGSEIDSYQLTDYGGNNNSLFQTYYDNYITRVFNKKTRIFKFNAILPLKVLLNITLDDLIVVGTRAYTINKMSTKLQSGETDFELLNEPS
tara:strand:+ start:5955 stop:8165 length:2211 start_codon:yes stop_codon:yes gene_type:complete